MEMKTRYIIACTYYVRTTKRSNGKSYRAYVWKDRILGVGVADLEVIVHVTTLSRQQGLRGNETLAKSSTLEASRVSPQ